jgi:hypothetical protein
MVNYVKEAARSVSERLKLQSYYRDTFSSPQGRAVLKHLSKVCHVGGTTFVAGDAHRSSFNEGMRYVALCILNQVNKDPMLYAAQLERQADGIDSTE